MNTPIPATLARLRQTFDSGKTRPLEVRTEAEGTRITLPAGGNRSWVPRLGWKSITARNRST